MYNNFELIKTHNKYQEILNKQKDNRKKYNLINTEKEIIEGLNVSLLPNFNNYNDPYISLELKYMKLICDLDSTNLNLTESSEIWNKFHDNSNETSTELMIFNTFYYNRLNKLNEYIVYDLKLFIDEVIAIICLIKNRVNNNKLDISSIGEYLTKHDIDYNEFDNFIDLFEKLNNLINAYKHSYANTEFAAIGRDENCFIALYSKYNNFSKNPEPYCISVNYIINEFNKFYKESFKLIDTLTKNIK